MSSFPYRAKATLKYRPPPTQGPSISFDKGQFVTVIASADEDGDWLEGENEQGVKGVFPATFVERVEEEQGERENQGTEQGGETVEDDKEEQLSAPPAVDKTQQVEEAPKPKEVEEQAASVASPTSPPPAPTSPPTEAERPPPSSTAKATPPPPAKKPNALAARIAAFNSTQAPAAPAPCPRPKPPSKWSRPSEPATSPSSTTSSLPHSSTTASDSPSEPQAVGSTSSDAKPKEFSAEDAKESIGRGGGSLRDRIKALQGLQIDQPAPPGRPPKPWKKKTIDSEDQQAEPSSGSIEATNATGEENSEKNLEDTIVKDEELKHDVERTDEEEKIPEIPSFEPAEPTPEPQREEAPSDTSGSVVGSKREDEPKPEANEQETKEESSSVPTSGKPSSIDLLSAMADSGPALMTPGSASLEVPSTPSPFIPSSKAANKPPVAPPSENHDSETPAEEEDSEAAKRSAIVARMAGLGGQKMGGVPIPALPKKTAGPKRAPRGGAKAASTPATPAVDSKEAEAPPVEAKEIEVEQDRVGEREEKAEVPAETDSPLAQPGSKEVEAETVQPSSTNEKEVEGDSEKKEDILASMGGASGLLAADDDEEETRNAEDDDDFDTPPPPTRPAAPAPPAPPAGAAQVTTLEDPTLEDGEEQVGEKEFAQRQDSIEDPTLADSAVETLPTPATSEPVVDQVEDEEEESAPAAPRVPTNRPPVPPAFVRQATDEPSSKSDLASHHFTADIDNPDEAKSAAPPPPARPNHPPPMATGSETVSDSPRPSASAPDDLAASSSPIPASVAGLALPKAGEEQHPPLPRHPAPAEKEKVTTDAEDRLMNEMEVMTPPQEAFDESTAAPELDAPSVLNLAEVRDSQQSADLSQQALPSPAREDGVPTRQEGVPTPAFTPPQVRSPPALQSPKDENGPSVTEQTRDDDADGEKGDEEEEEDDEDPEVTRRRAIAARMAKLGGMNMRMGPMIPPMGGMMGGGPPKKKAPKPVKNVEEEKEIEASDLQEQVVESQSSGTVTPDHPARRYGGIPAGGFALPGITSMRQAPPPEASNKVEPTEDDTLPEEQLETTEAEAEVEAEEAEEEEAAPPPLPAGRPLSMPPRRSVPPPQLEQDTVEVEQQEPDHAEESVTEPEQHESEMPPPPPPARPAGRHQSSLPPQSPSLPPMSAVPSSPPSRAVPPPSSHRESTLSLGRSTTRSSRRSSTQPTTAANMGFASPRQSLDLAFDAERVQGGGGGGPFLAKDVDLDAQTGNAWWRTQGGLPRSLQGRRDVAVDVVSDQPGEERHEKEIEIIYSDFSRTLVSITFDPNDTTETTTSLSQNHFPPPSKPSLDHLLQWSASLGAQVFAAAHLKASDKSARGLTDEQFVDFCFSRATDPVPRIGSTFGAKVYEASIEGKKGPSYAEDDEPRAGDVVVFRDVKVKQTLGSKSIGSHLAIVGGWDSKKSKLRVLEVDKNGSVDEGSYKVDDLKQGTITIFRVMGRDYL